MKESEGCMAWCLYSKEIISMMQTNSDWVRAVSGWLLVRLQLIIFVTNIHPFIFHYHLTAAAKMSSHATAHPDSDTDHYKTSVN